jgi:hypothetical protein
VGNPSADSATQNLLRPLFLSAPVVLALIACGAPAASVSGPTTPSVGSWASSGPDASSSAPLSPTDASEPNSLPGRHVSPTTASSSPLPPDHPFAATASEATALIDAAVDSRASALVPCVAAARARRKNPHDRVQIEIGLDQEGHLIGVKSPRGATSDPDLSMCARNALAGANFPTSHAGIITVTKTFEDQAVYP